MAVWSYAMIALSIYSVVAGKPIDSSVASMYGVAIAAYAASKTYKETRPDSTTSASSPTI